LSSPTESKRPDRLGDLLLAEISRLLVKEVNDPRVREITLTRAEVSGDLRRARIYFSPLPGGREPEEVSAGLRSARGFIRARLSKDLALRFMPSLEFLYDEAGAKAGRIEELLRQIKK
jgi:ribosome-binding factor A